MCRAVGRGRESRPFPEPVTQGVPAAQSQAARRGRYAQRAKSVQSPNVVPAALHQVGYGGIVLFGF